MQCIQQCSRKIFQSNSIFLTNLKFKGPNCLKAFRWTCFSKPRLVAHSVIHSLSHSQRWIFAGPACRSWLENSMLIQSSVQICKYASMQVWKYASIQVCSTCMKYASFKVCFKYVGMQVCKYAIFKYKVFKYASRYLFKHHEQPHYDFPTWWYHSTILTKLRINCGFCLR